MAKRATPEMFRMFKLCLLLYHTFNEQIPENDWLSLNFDQANTSRQTNFNIRKKQSINGGNEYSQQPFPRNQQCNSFILV
jgi:hypothetical protein